MAGKVILVSNVKQPHFFRVIKLIQFRVPTSAVMVFVCAKTSSFSYLPKWTDMQVST